MKKSTTTTKDFQFAIHYNQVMKIKEILDEGFYEYTIVVELPDGDTEIIYRTEEEMYKTEKEALEDLIMLLEASLKEAKNQLQKLS